jgi:hypothetical protein
MALKEHIHKLRQVNEDEKKSLEFTKTNFKEKVLNIEDGVKVWLSEEKENHKNFVEGKIKKLESEIYQYEKENKSENEKIRKVLKNLENFLDVNSNFYV